MNFSRTVVTALAATLLIAGCSSGGSAEDSDDEESIDEGALSTAGRSLVGEYASDEDTYATELKLEADGTFTAKFNPRVVGVHLACVRAPCLAQGDGTWTVASSGRLTLKVKHLTGTTGTRSLTFNHRLTHGIIPILVLDKVVDSKGEQSFRGQGTAGAGCAATLCGPGTQCVERSNGVARCVPTTTSAGECDSDSDCRAVDDYCRGCNCRALASGEQLPACTTSRVRCTKAPCATKTAACVNGTCTVR